MLRKAPPARGWGGSIGGGLVLLALAGCSLTGTGNVETTTPIPPVDPAATIEKMMIEARTQRDTIALKVDQRTQYIMDGHATVKLVLWLAVIVAFLWLVERVLSWRHKRMLCHLQKLAAAAASETEPAPTEAHQRPIRPP